MVVKWDSAYENAWWTLNSLWISFHFQSLLPFEGWHTYSHHPKVRHSSNIYQALCRSVSQPWCCSHFGLNNSLLWEAVLCAIGCLLAASLASTHLMPVRPPPQHNNQKCLQILSNGGHLSLKDKTAPCWNYWFRMIEGCGWGRGIYRWKDLFLDFKRLTFFYKQSFVFIL